MTLQSVVLITQYFQAMICLAGMGSFLWSSPALQSVTLILTMLIRKLSLSSAKAGQFLGFLQKKLCIYYHPFTRSEGKTLSREKLTETDCFLFAQDCHSCSHSSTLLIRHHLHHPRQLLRHGGAGHRVSPRHPPPPQRSYYSCLVLLFCHKLQDIFLIFQINPIIY